MDRLQEMRVFCAVVEEHGFATAARRVGLSAPAVTRSVASLEKRIGAQLLDRGAGSIRLTDAGRRFHEEARLILADVDLADESAGHGSAEPKGHVVISTPVLFGESVLAPLMLEWLDAHPQVTMRAQFVDRFPNLHEEGIDLAVLMGPVPEPGLTVVMLGRIRRVVCAAPAYLAARKAPEVPEALESHRIVQSTADSPGAEWRFDRGGHTTAVRIKPALKVSTNLAAIETARAGFGITRVMSYQVADDIAAGRLVALLADADDTDLAVQLVHLQGRDASPKVGRLVAFLGERLLAHPALLQR